MTRNMLKKFTDLWKQTEDQIMELDHNYGIQVWQSSKANFYNNYNLLIHNLLVELIGEEKSDMVENYCFDLNPLYTFDELCNKLNINEINSI